MYIVMVLVFLVGVGLGVGFPIIYYSDTIQKRDREITALKIGKAELTEHAQRADLEVLTIRNHAAEWRGEAVRLSGRVHELTDRLLLVGKIPEIDDGSEPMSVAEADNLAVEQDRREQHERALRAPAPKKPEPSMEPLAVNDEEVPPVARLHETEASDEEEDTSFASRIGHDG